MLAVTPDTVFINAKAVDTSYSATAAPAPSFRQEAEGPPFAAKQSGAMLRISSPAVGTVRILDVNGRTVCARMIDGRDAMIPLRGLSSGLYVVFFEKAGQRQCARVNLIE